ncbi:type II secretion system minor pseudopilin GspI [Azohydromonas lata]|uniref:type II secretion system minor pseudopilin GspI n=1 Tax=Azohydromonas lata TaxID=45677 RepID=UPI0021753199|nr:type II secretion system minor pseudopilin GspI [Azohydromonas lata]
MSARPRGRGARAGGFTLVEMLVALAVMAIALIASHKAGASLIRGAAWQNDLLLGRLCAENVLIELRLRRELPGLGRSERRCEQAGLQYVVQLGVRATARADTRHIDVQVLREGLPVLRLSTAQARLQVR